MSSVNTLSGRHGRISTAAASATAVPPTTSSIVARVTNWAVNPTMASSSEWGDSSCGGYTARKPGRRDATFTAEGKYDSDTPIVWNLFDPASPDGDNVDIVGATLWLDNQGTGGSDLYWDFPRAMCNDFNLVVDVDTEEVVGWTAAFGADGIFYKPGQTTGNAQSGTIFS